MERLTTDNPRNNTEVALNLVYVKDGQAWVRNGGPAPGYPDVELYDYMRLIVADHGPMSIKADLTDDELGDALYDALFDGIETKEGLCAMLYTLAWAFAELRQRLAAYEDTGLEPDEITDFLPTLKEWRQNMGALRHVHELVTAEAEGRLVVLETAPRGSYEALEGDKINTPKTAKKLRQYEQDAYDGRYGSDWLEEVGEGLRFYAEYCVAHNLEMTMAGFLKYVNGLHNGEIYGGNIPPGYFEEAEKALEGMEV